MKGGKVEKRIKKKKKRKREGMEIRENKKKYVNGKKRRRTRKGKEKMIRDEVKKRKKKERKWPGMRQAARKIDKVQGLAARWPPTTRNSGDRDRMKDFVSLASAKGRREGGGEGGAKMEEQETEEIMRESDGRERWKERKSKDE